MSNSFYLYPVSEAECSEITAKMKISYTGRDVMPIKLLIHARHLLARPISALINESFTSGVFPEILKIAKITPIFKNGNPLVVSNYRPISVLPWLSKIFKKVLACRLINKDFFDGLS